MPANFGGRLGAILKKYPKVTCPECQSPQVQIVDYLVGDSGWECRKCKYMFGLEFSDHEEIIRSCVGKELV